MYVEVDTIDTDYMEGCPPCTSCHPELTAMGFTWTVLKALVQAAIIAWPAYKTYKAVESNNLRHCQAMLAFWTVTTIMNALKEFSDEVLGKYSSYFLWKFTILLLKLLPLALTPDYIYSHFVQPFFSSHQKSIDSVVEAAETTKQSVMSLPKEGVERTKEKLEEVKEKIMMASEGMKERLEDIGTQIKETLSPSLGSRRLTPSLNSGSEEDDLVELDQNGEQLVKLRQRKPLENKMHLRQLSMTKREAEAEGEGEAAAASSALSASSNPSVLTGGGSGSGLGSGSMSGSKGWFEKEQDRNQEMELVGMSKREREVVRELQAQVAVKEAMEGRGAAQRMQMDSAQEWGPNVQYKEL